MHGLFRCNINADVHARPRGRSGRVTQRCHNSPRWETGLASANDVTHRKRAEVLGRFWKSQEALGRCRTKWGGGRWKSQNRKSVYLSLCWRTFNLKGNKKFRTWTEKSIRVFRISRFLCSVLYIYEHPMYISHIHVYGYGTPSTSSVTQRKCIGVMNRW